MLDYLGPRGRTVTAVVAVVTLAAALLAGWQRDWSLAVGLATLSYVAVVATGIWGATKSVSATIGRAAEQQHTMHRQQRGQLRALQTKVDRARSELEVLTGAKRTRPSVAESTLPVERRFAGYLDQPMSLPNSNLLSFLEILAKDATTRRADDAVLRQSIAELRELVETQHAEIGRLHGRLVDLETRGSRESVV